MLKEDTLNVIGPAQDDPQQTAIAADQPGFFGQLAKAVIAIFGPNHDDYPATGVQPFTGELSHKY